MVLYTIASIIRSDKKMKFSIIACDSNNRNVIFNLLLKNAFRISEKMPYFIKSVEKITNQELWVNSSKIEIINGNILTDGKKMHEMLSESEVIIGDEMEFCDNFNGIIEYLSSVSSERKKIIIGSSKDISKNYSSNLFINFKQVILPWWKCDKFNEGLFWHKRDKNIKTDRFDYATSDALISCGWIPYSPWFEKMRALDKNFDGINAF
jgi:hypothetical protein